MIDLKTEYEKILNSSLSEPEKTYFCEEIDREGNYFDTYHEVYLNSFFINIYTIFENTLLGLYKNHCPHNGFKGNLSLLEKYLNVIKKTIGIEFLEIQSEFDLINGSYRKLRNCLIHSRYDCTEKEVEDFKNLKAIRLIKSEFSGNLKPQIENKDFIIEFIEKIKYLTKTIYVLFHNNYTTSVGLDTQNSNL